jgi:hypothetical protein
VLVIYRITLPPEATLPVELTMRIPVEAGDPHAVAVRQGGSPFSVTYDRQVSGGWALITFTATSPEAQIEYYDPRLTKTGIARGFEFTYPGDYAADALLVQVQQPVGASQMQLSEGQLTTSTGQDGLTYFATTPRPNAAGQEYRLSLNYQKSSDALSAESLQVEPAAPLSSADAGPAGWTALLPWLLGALGLLLVLGGGWWYWQSGREGAANLGELFGRRKGGKTHTASARHRSSRAADADAPAVSARQTIYCHQCGKRATAGDRFCRACGQRLRAE